jgi:hypothetical protein
MEYNAASIKKLARIGGVFYLIIILAGICGELLIKNKIIVSGDPAGTAANMLRYETLWRLAIALDLLMHICDVPLMVIFYVLLKPVNKTLALVSLLLTLVQTAAMVATKLNLAQSLFPLGSGTYLKAFTPEQLRVLSYLSIRSDQFGFNFGLLFFGFACLILGYLVFRSGYIPKFIGVLMQIAGVCYITNSFAQLIVPNSAGALLPAILLPCFIAELSFCLWLLVKGINAVKWEAKMKYNTQQNYISQGTEA